MNRDGLTYVPRPAANRNVTVAVSNFTTTFTVTVRSLNGVSEEEIKRILQTRREVISVEKTKETVSVR